MKYTMHNSCVKRLRFQPQTPQLLTTQAKHVDQFYEQFGLLPSERLFAGMGGGGELGLHFGLRKTIIV